MTPVEVMRERLGSIDSAIKILNALYAAEYACVPIKETEGMLKAAWADALAEDASGVWECMVKFSQIELGILESEEVP